VGLASIVSELLSSTRASRTTVRMRDVRGTFPVVAEGVSPGTRSMSAAADIDPRAGATFEALAGSDRIIVQRDVAAAEPAPPADLVSLYGVRAQMVAPVHGEGSLEAIVSVHECSGPRDWTGDDLQALREAVDRVRRLVRGSSGEHIDAGGTA
jgi:maleate isomerase